MTPKEKAEELINKHRIILIQSDTDAGEEIICTTIAKQCALIAVEQIETITKHYPPEYMLTVYWQQVKKEIKKL